MISDVDRVKSGITTFIQRTLGAIIINRIDYLAHYPCKVVSQNGDGTLELIADDIRVGTFNQVPIRYGVPGIVATVPAGSRCYVTWGGGDSRKPIVVDWELGTVLSLKLGGGGAIEALIKGTSFKSALDTWLDAWIIFLTGLTAANLSAKAAVMLAATDTTPVTGFKLAIANILSTVTKTL